VADPPPAAAVLVGAVLAGPEPREEFMARCPERVLSKGLRDLAAVLAGIEASENGTVNLLAHFAKGHMQDELRANNYLTNDMIEIRGGLGRFDYRELRVNGVSVSMDRREFVLAALLAHSARAQKKQAALLGAPRCTFMPVDKILAAIDVLKARHPELGDVWNDATFHNIHQVVAKFRKKLETAHLNKYLLESRASGAGYRWSTRPGNIDGPGLGEDPA
jgi:hypothetical protein